MKHRVLKTFAYFAATWAVLLLTAPAYANTDMSAVVSKCARLSGVSSGYYVKTLTIGRDQSLYVPPGGSVNPSKAEQINSCIFRDIAARTGLSTSRASPNPPNVADACRAEFSQKLRLTRNGLDYKSGNVAARLFGRLLGRNHGIQLLNEEYDRCLRQVANRNSRCRGGVLVGGDGYCIRRPYR